MRFRRVEALLVLAASTSCCTNVEDVVFDVLAVEVGDEPLLLNEGAGVVELPVRLNREPTEAVSARYRLIELEAQSGCQTPDFFAAEGILTWAAGVREVFVPVWIGDDALAETDERLLLSIEATESAPRLANASISLLIADDDRTELIDASAFGVVPGRGHDQSAALQQALDRARDLGRGVVVMAPGDYDLRGVNLAAGTSLSARGVRWHRPLRSRADSVAVQIEHAGAPDSADTLVEGLTLDGQRDEQGEYRNDELAAAHLIALYGSPDTRGRLRATVQDVDLASSTGSGVFVGPQGDATLCRIRGTDLWRDLVTLRGGGSRVDARELDANAALGTTGLWFDGQPAGYDGTHRIEVTLFDAHLASGDLEIEAYAGSRIEIERLSMTRGPLRLHAPDATVRIRDSVLQMGVPSESHNYIGVPHDVEIKRTALVAGETDANGDELPEANRELSAVLVRWELAPESPPDLPGLLPFAPGPHRLLFEACTFQRAPGVDSLDSVYGVQALGAGGSVVLRAPSLGPDLLAPFAPDCSGCVLEP